MCGICGKFDIQGSSVSEDLLKKMCQAIAYRGPDDEGIMVSPPVGLGHRRLSIIDLSSAGHEPMSNEDGSLWLVFNGEIYDFKSLRSLVQAKGHRLRSDTDCETLLHLYEEEGYSCLRHLNGMFAFGLYDRPRERLWLGRDRLGIKPLYYYWDGKRFLFASEIKAILCDPDVTREIDAEALDLYLTLNYVPAPKTIYKNIRKLLPGHFLVVERGGLSEVSYWDVPLESHPVTANSRGKGEPMARCKEELKALIEASVKRRLIADVPLGAFLSGGIDSSIVVALMARNSSRPIKTFSIGYVDLPSFDETRYARQVAEFNGTDHHEFKLGYRDILDAFPRVLENLDEPFADSSCVPTYIVSRETRKHVTVALSGDGGDELFAGYRMYSGEFWSRYYSKLPRFVRESVIAPLIRTLPDARDNPGLEKIRRVKKFISGMDLRFPERFCAWREIFPFSMRRNLLKEPPQSNLYLEAVQAQVAEKEDRFLRDPVNFMLYLDVKGLLPGDMLNKVDRMSMANALEVRVPFLDYNLVEYVFRLRGDTKLGPRGGKVILRETFKDMLPPSLHRRSKWGFEMPIAAWLRKELRFLPDEYLRRDLVERQGIFNYDMIHAMVDDHMRGRRDTSWQIWNLIVFQHWYNSYMGRP
jgi:asparagine synthase (glutamine-hydrolysing)